MLASCLASPLTAQIAINWGTGFAFNRIVESDGSTIASPGNGFTYEIGTFGSGFTPTASNIDQWAANWKAFDDQSFFFQLGSSNNGLYVGSATLQSDQTSSETGNSFAIGEQAYVWIYNDNNPATIGTTTEWSLYTRSSGSPWQMPDAGTPGPTESWFVTAADTAVWGGVDSGADVGSGTIISTPGSYHVQTATLTAGTYWDMNGATAGSGGPTPNGTWNSANSNWSDDPAGEIATGTFTDYKVATFSAGSDATGTYTVTKDGSASVFGLDFQNGTVTIAHGTGGEIVFDTNSQIIAFDDGTTDGLVSTAFINVASGHTATIETAISGSQDLNITGGGTLVLAGSQTGEIDGTVTLSSGVLQMSGTGANPRLGFNSPSASQTNVVIDGGTLLISETTPATDVQFGDNTGFTYASGNIVLGDANESVGTMTLTLSSDSTIEFNGGSGSILAFDDSSGETWSGGGDLLLTGWDGDLDGGGTDQLFFGTSDSGLTSGQLGRIKFVNPAGLPTGIYDAKILMTGEVVPQVVPEPGTVAAGALLLLFAGADVWRRRVKRGPET